MIETKEQYEAFKDGQAIRVVVGGREIQVNPRIEMIETIEALREVARQAKLLAPYHDTQELDEALDALSDWITEE